MNVIWTETPCTEHEILPVAIPSIYDDTCFYYCTECNTAWHKFEDPGMRGLVERFVGSDEVSLREKV